MQILQPAPLSEPHTRPSRRQERGFTVIELMVVVSIVAILAAIAGPSFNPIIERWRVQQSVKGLEASLYFARAEAIKRGGNVTLRKEDSGTNGCPLATETDSWDCGWFVFVDTNTNGILNAGEEVLQRFQTPQNMDVQRTNGGAAIQFDRWGRISGTYAGFSVIPHNKNISDLAARGLCMSSGGRIRIIKSEDMPCTSG